MPPLATVGLLLGPRPVAPLCYGDSELPASTVHPTVPVPFEDPPAADAPATSIPCQGVEMTRNALSITNGLLVIPYNKITLPPDFVKIFTLYYTTCNHPQFQTTKVPQTITVI